MDRDREQPMLGHGRAPLLRALIDHVRGRGEARRRTRAREQRLQDLPSLTVLSTEGSREVIDELVHGSPLTPERRATLERMRRRDGVRPRWAEIEQGRHYPGEPVVLSEAGSREVLEEIKNGSPDTPGRRAMFELVQQMAEVRKRRPGSPQHVERKR